ncbi:MAG: ABC transporter permease, partial [Terracidiphilus sp.]
MKTVFQDIRFGIRQLIKMPGFTLTAIVSLALGIGATTAVFSVVYAILLDPYPYRDANRMIHMRLIMPDGQLQGFLGITRAEWQQVRKSPVVEDTFLQGTRNLPLSSSDLPEDVLGVDLT